MILSSVIDVKVGFRMSHGCDIDTKLQAAASAIRDANTLVITAGAGMGVDSGLPDFRGKEGFWKAYPPLKKLGVSYAGISNPE